MILSICICTLPEQRNVQYLERLMNLLGPQVERCKSQVQILINDAPRTKTTGEKRNMLYDLACGEYVVCIDDDDVVPDYYVDEILKAAESKPDVITFKGYMTTDGHSRVDFVLRLGEKYEERNGVYYRYPNHIVPMRKAAISGFRFPHLTQREDYIFATQIHEAQALKTEVHIDKFMYVYDFKTKK